jgi:hypothetical protein
MVTDGKIDLCPKAGCGFRCCEFQQGNYIVLHPGELDAARSGHESLDHLEITDDGRGGHRATCRAARTETCDDGYKPLDCRSYPYFPVLAEDEARVTSWLLKGRKCPLVPHEIDVHGKWVIEQWNILVESSPAIATWLRRVVLVGYDLTSLEED